MENMVNELLESEPHNTPRRRHYEFAAPTPKGDSFDVNVPTNQETPQGVLKPFLVTDLVQQMMRTPSGNELGYSAHRPVLPSIENSPFALQPGETSPATRPATARRISPQGAETVTLQSFPMSASNSQTGFGRQENQRPLESSSLAYQHLPQHQASLPMQQHSSFPGASHYTTTTASQDNFGPPHQHYQPIYQPASRTVGNNPNSYGPNFGTGATFYGGFGSGFGGSSSPVMPEAPKSSAPNYGAIGGPVPKGKGKGRGKARRVDPTPPSGQVG
jgi:hypothetical protein